MRYRPFISLLTTGLLLLGLPAVSLAAGTIVGTSESQNFKLNGINFGSNVTLITTQNQEPPAISSDGPTVTELKPTQVTITWKTDKPSSSTVEYGLTTAYGLQNGSTDQVTLHVVTLFGLTPQTQYHFRVQSTQSGQPSTNIGQSNDRNFTTPAQNGVESIRISDVTYDSALVSWQTGNVTNSTLDYGTSTAYGQSKKDQSGSLTTNHSIQLTGLSLGTDYHVRITATDSQGNSVSSSDFGFTTLANPAFVSIKVTGNSPNQVTIDWKTNVPTSGVIKVNLKGQTDGQSLGTDELLQVHQTVVGTLLGTTSYVAVIVATDAQGRQVTSSPQEFSTVTDTTPPVVSALKVDINNANSSLVMTSTWKTDELSTTEGTLEAKGSGKPAVALTKQMTPSTEHVLAKGDLLPATPYVLTVISVDPSGNKVSQSISFITPAVHKSILQLLLDSLANAFGWAGKVFK